MASPEVVESSGILVPGFHGEPFALEGWKKKLTLKKGGTLKKKDVIYVAPDGEEIRSQRQLEKYLKNHPGGPSVADFDWSTGETPRRSARLSRKGRLSSGRAEAEPALKRVKVDQEEDPVIVVSPKKSYRRKLRPQVVSTGKDQVTVVTEKINEGDSTSADGLTIDSDAKLADENTLPLADEMLVNNADGKHEEESRAAIIEQANRGEVADQVPFTDEVISVGNSAAHVTSEGQASKTRQTLILTDIVLEEITAVEAVTEIGEVVTLEQPAQTSIEVPAVEEVVQPTEGEISLKEDEDVKGEMGRNILHVPTTEQLHGTDDDLLTPKELVESQSIHALIVEPVLSGVIKPLEQQTDHSLPAPERVGVSS